MNIIISNKSSKPIYEQIKNQIKDLIIRGDLKKGECLPGMRSLASDLRVSLITTKRAYKDLENEGFIYTVPAKGSYVASLNKDFLYEDRIKKIEEKLDQAIKISKSIKLGKDDLIEILENLYT